MFDSIFKWIREVLHLLIPGLIYFIDIAIIIQYSSNFVWMDFIKSNNDYLIYFVFLITVISYILGYTLNLAVQNFIWLIKPSLKDEFKKSLNADNSLQIRYKEYFYSLIMLRHLIISFLLLGPILLICRFENGLFDFKWIYVILWILYLSMLVYGYFHLQLKQRLINEKVKGTIN
jgi:hypothetical protein